MKLITVLHFYQPHNQQFDILNRIVNESYRPIVKGLIQRPNAKIVINISGVLTKMLYENDYKDLVDDLKVLSERGQVEFTGSSMYHAFLPLLNEDEVVRQIETNNKVNKEFYGESYSTVGFFSPELAINDKVLRMSKDAGFKWVAASQVAHPDGNPKKDRLYKSDKDDIVVFFRNKPVSYIILSAMVKSPEELQEEMKDKWDEDKYWFIVMDAETFGHHRIGHEKLLFKLWDSPLFESVTARDLLGEGYDTEAVTVRPSTWTNEEQDFWLDKDMTKSTTAKSYILWKDPSNPIHDLQWELTDLAILQVHNFSDKNAKQWETAREDLDKAVASDQYWWASAKPWWSLEMVEQGAFSLREVILTLDVDEDIKKKAKELYRQILDKAFEWQRTGYIRKKHLETSGTYMKEPLRERTSNEWFNQLVLEFEFEMSRATKDMNFEKAIKWRDAIEKIKEGTDIFDIKHVVDELWLGRNIPAGDTNVKPFLSHEWDEFSDFAKKHFIEVDSKEEFDNWKTRSKQSKKDEAKSP